MLPVFTDESRCLLCSTVGMIRVGMIWIAD